MNIPSKMYLTQNQINTLSSIRNEKLKSIFVDGLLSSTSSNSLKVAQIALDLIKASSPTPHQESFFIHLLKESGTGIIEVLQKVDEIVKKGHFNKLINSINKIQQQNSSFATLQKKIEEYRLKMRKDEFSNISQNKNFSLEIERCQIYHELSKVIFSLKNVELKTLAHYLHEKLNVDYGNFFEDDEKLALAKMTLSSIADSPASYTILDINECLSQAARLRKMAGEEVLAYFAESFSTEKDLSLEQVMGGLDLLNCASDDPSTFFSFIENWRKSGFLWNYLLENIEPTKRPIEPFLEKNLSHRIERFKNDITVKTPLSDSDLELIQGQYEKVEQLCKEHENLTFNQMVHKAQEIREKSIKEETSREDRLLLIAIGCLSLYHYFHFKIFPHSSQILVLLGLLLKNDSRQAQVKTGEGKTIIIALWTFVLAMEGRCIDIITSDRVLAMGAQKKFALYFQKFGVITGHICRNDVSPSDFKAHVLYGCSEDFEFAWMRDELEGTKFYEARKTVPYVKRIFDCACIDESDNLLIDTAANGARLSFPSEISYEWTYPHVLAYVETLQLKTGFKNEVESLRKLLVSKATKEKVQSIHSLSNDQLEIWLRSASRALFEIKRDEEYVVLKKRNTKEVKKNSIQIIDLKNGRISENCRWSNGVHEFLELKHDITVEKESLNPISLSHAVFFKFYKMISALTGTAEKYQTKQIYQIETFDAPPHLPLQRKDLPIVIEKTAENHFRKILSETVKYLKLGRPLLIICLTIKDSNKLAQYLRENNIICSLLNEVQEELEHHIIARAGESKSVTIATNTAGRGTDILLSEESLKNGGLHVLLTSYPESERVEDQAIGRAGRQGQPGSSQIIIHRQSQDVIDLIGDESLPFSDEDVIEFLKTKRMIRELQQIVFYCSRATSETFLAKLTHSFFQSFRLWSEKVHTEEFLNTLSQRLGKLRLRNRKKFNFDHLKHKDRLLGEKCIDLMHSTTDFVEWKVFLKNAVERIKQKVLVDWSIHFYQTIEQQLQGKHEKDQNQQIQNLFDLHKSKWEKYLTPDGLGLIDYLKELTGINFSK